MTFRHYVAGLALAIAGLTGSVQAAPSSQIFVGRCAMCHQSSAAGLPGQYPRLAGRVGPIATTPDGRHYLVMVLLNGLTGSIQVDGKPITGFMPPFAMLKDQEVADTLNYLTTLQPSGKKPAPFTAAEVAKVRVEKRVPGSAVAAERQKLVAAKAIP